jgi:predicted lipoprotein with Yx(FWY)xxD motif
MYSTPSTATPVVVTTKHTKLGTILGAGPKRLTVYLFEADTAGKSNCAGACASACGRR